MSAVQLAPTDLSSVRRRDVMVVLPGVMLAMIDNFIVGTAMPTIVRLVIFLVGSALSGVAQT